MVYTSLSVYYWSQLVYMHLNRVYNYAFVVLYVSTYHSRMQAFGRVPFAVQWL